MVLSWQDRKYGKLPFDVVVVVVVRVVVVEVVVVVFPK